MSEMNSKFAENAQTVTPREKVPIPKGYTGPLVPFGQGLVPCSTGNGAYILVKIPGGEGTGMLFAFSDEQQAQVQECYNKVRGGNAFACVIAGPEGGDWNGISTACSVDEPGKAYCF